MVGFLKASRASGLPHGINRVVLVKRRLSGGQVAA
jgi:hypothetical protein